MRRIVSILLAILLCVPLSSFAEGDILLLEWVEDEELEVIELLPEEPAPVRETAVEPAEEILLELAEEPEAPMADVPVYVQPAEENRVLYSDLVLGGNYAMVGQRSIRWRVEAWNGKAPFSVSTWVTLDGDVVYAAEERLNGDGAASFDYMPEHFGVHTVHAVVRDAAGNQAEHQASLPVSVDEYETEITWERSVQDVALTGDWAQDLVAIARSQLGYEESQRNFIVDKNGFVHGFTRYGAWYGSAYANWCAMFVSFCLHYAGVPASAVPYEAGCAAWINQFAGMGVYFKKNYQPKAGDIVFLTFEDNGHVGIVSDVQGDAFTTIEGNVGRCVVRHSYHLSDPEILGFVSMRALKARAGQTVEEDEVVVVEIAAEPEPLGLITRQPESREVAVLGDEVVFSAQVVEGAACQWQFSDGSGWKDLSDGNTLSGAGTDTLRLVSGELRASYAYRLVAVSDQGTEISDTVRFHAQEKAIAHELTFDRQPRSTVIATLGDEVIFSAQAEGAAYQWQYNSGSGWKDLTESATWHGVKTDTLRFVSSAPRLDCQYRVVITGSQGVKVSNRVRFAVAEGEN